MRGEARFGVQSASPLAPQMDSATQSSNFLPIRRFRKSSKKSGGASTSLFQSQSKSICTSMGAAHCTPWVKPVAPPG